jgi:hypothetical protein
MDDRVPQTAVTGPEYGAALVLLLLLPLPLLLLPLPLLLLPVLPVTAVLTAEPL